MSEQDTADSLIEFPCQYQIKVMGKDCEAFHSTVRAIISSHVETLDEGNITHRASNKGSYVSISAEVPVDSREHLEKIYIALRGCEHVLFTL